MPTVVNRHHHADPRSRKPDRRPPLPEPWVYVGRGTPLGNPFTVGEHGPAALDMYRAWLRERVEMGDAAVMKALRSITAEHHLVCSCAPRPCHAGVIVEVWAEVFGEPAPAAASTVREPLRFATRPALLCRLCGRATRCRPCGGRGKLLTEPVHPEEAKSLR